MRDYHETVVIGGGPAGLTAGMYLRRAGIDAVLVERSRLGGTAARTERVENYPGFPKGVSGPDLMTLMADQAKGFGLEIREFFHVVELSRTADGTFLISSDTSGEIEAKGVIVATGTDWKKVGIPGEQEFAGRGVSYCATCDGWFFEGCDVAVIGGGDSAVEEALTLANLCRRVYVVHRRDRLRAQKIIQETAFRQKKIEFVWNKKPLRITGRDQVESVLLEDTGTGEKSELNVAAVFIFVGLEANTEFLRDLVDRKGGFAMAQEDLSSKTQGLFVAGDARNKTLRQISTAVGDGALAAVNLQRYLLERGQI